MTIIINEEQKKRLMSEARMDGFRIDNMRTMSFAAKVRYCKQWLGNPIGNGSSRMVFQLDDHTVLKLAKNQKGVAQNEAEFIMCNSYYSLYMFPKVFNGSDEDNYQWIISEYVLPAKAADFKHVYGENFGVIIEFCWLHCMYDRTRKQNYHDRIVGLRDEFEGTGLEDLFSELESYKYDFDGNLGDLTRIKNWGIVNRNGKTEIVALDLGFTSDVADQYYKRR